MFSYDGAATSALRPPKPANPFGFTGRHSEPVCPTPDYGIPVFANAVYYPNWRIYKKQPPSSLRLGYVSHVFYAFAGVKPDGTVHLSDEWADEQMPVDDTEGCIRAFTQLKPQYSQMKVLLSVGGGGEACSGNFAAVASDPVTTRNFVLTVKELVDRFGLDGLDVDWEHPSDEQQGTDYVNLLASLREELPSPRYILTSALPAGEWALRNINLYHAQYYLDFINLMCYDFAGPWTGHSGHQSQLYTPLAPHSEAAVTSCQSGVIYVLANGVPSRKILLGIPAYGRAFPGTDRIGQEPATRVESTGDGNEADETEKCLEFDYCDLPRPGTKEQYDQSAGAAFCVDDDGGAGFITYDSTQTVRQKARFASEMNLGGLFYWHIAADARGDRSLIATGYNALHGF